MKISSTLLFLLGSILLSPHASYALRDKKDSLRNLLKTAKDDSIKVKILNNLTREMETEGEYKSADSVAMIALQLAQELNYKKGEGNTYRNIGNINTDKGNYSEALKNHLLSLKIDQEIGNKQGVCAAYGNIGLIYAYQGNYPEALKNQLQSLKIAEELGDKESMGYAYGDIGSIYRSQGNYAEALNNELESLKIAEEIGNKQNLCNVYGNIGNLYEAAGNYTEALKSQFKALKLREEIGDKDGMGIEYVNIGSVYQAMGNYSEALKNELLGLALEKEFANEEGICAIFINMGDAYTKQKNYSKAKKYLDSALIIAKHSGLKDMIADGYNSFTILDSAIGDFKDAYTDYNKYIVYRDSLKNEENTKKIVSEQMNYEFDKKQEAEKAEQDKKDLLANTEKRKQEIITRIVSAGLFLVLIFSGLLFSRFRITRKQKKIIEEQKVIVEVKNKEVLDSITYAKRLQDAILPPMSLINKYFPESFVLYKPKDIVAGDFYWMERAGEVVLIAACDCTGHGVPGAMVSMVCSNALNRAVKEFKIIETGKILDKVRELVLETFSQRDPFGEKSENDVKDGMDISLCCINTQTKVIQWSGAYNPLWYIQDNEMKEVAPDKQPIGKQDNSFPFNTHKLELKQGSVLYLFTDGYASQFGGPDGKKFMYKQLKEWLLELSKMSMAKQDEALNQTLLKWKGNLEQVDDVLIIGIRV